MVAPFAPRTWVNREIPPVDTWNEDLYATWQFLLNPPMCKARQTTLQSVVTGSTWVVLAFQVEDVDNYGFHSTSVNPSRFTPTVAGWYKGYFGYSFKPLNTAADTTGRRMGAIRMNGNTGTYYGRADTLAPNIQNANVVAKGNQWGPLYFNGTTDYVEVIVMQNSGSTLTTDVGAGATDYEEQPEFYMRWWSA
jgi:hypothetical protein